MKIPRRAVQQGFQLIAQGRLAIKVQLAFGVGRRAFFVGAVVYGIAGPAEGSPQGLLDFRRGNHGGWPDILCFLHLADRIASGRNGCDLLYPGDQGATATQFALPFGIEMRLQAREYLAITLLQGFARPGRYRSDASPALPCSTHLPVRRTPVNRLPVRFSFKGIQLGA